jgi:GFO/IDH/MocA oxidoreductase family protein
VDDRRAEATYKRFPNVPRYKDFRQMLDKEGKNIDAVIVATPDHMHATAAMWCMERNKHVYVQKPLVRTIWEARQLREAAAKYGVATQMGNQGYSNEGTRQCAEMIWNGDIGKVTEVHAWTDRPLWPQGLTEIPPPDPVPPTLDWDLWLGPLGWLLLSAVQLARLLRFRLRGAGRYGVPHPGCAQHGAAPVQAQGHRRGVHEERRGQLVHVPEGLRNPL